MTREFVEVATKPVSANIRVPMYRRLNRYVDFAVFSPKPLRLIPPPIRSG
jgi:hypothetical protein